MNGVYLRALPAGRVRRRARRATCASRASTGPRSGARDGAARAGEDREARRVPRVRRLPLRARSSPTGADSTETCSRRPREALDGGRAVGGGRGSRRRCARSPSGSGLKPRKAFAADPRRGHRLEGLAGPVREPRAARPRRVARAAQAPGRRQRLERRERVERALERDPRPAAVARARRRERASGLASLGELAARRSASPVVSAFSRGKRKSAVAPVRGRGTVRGRDGRAGGRHVKARARRSTTSARSACSAASTSSSTATASARPPRSPRRGGRSSAATPDVVLLDVHVGADDGLRAARRARALELPVARRALLGRARSAPSSRGRVDARAREAVRARRARRGRRLAAADAAGRLADRERRRRFAPRPSSRSASRATSSSAPRRAAPCAWGRRRSPSRRRSSRATPTSSAREQLEALREAEDAAEGDERERLYRLRKTCEGGLVSAELAEREDELENRILAARVDVQGRGAAAADRAGEARRARRPTPTATSSASSRPTRAPAFNDDRLELLARRRGARGRALRRARRRRAQRGGEGRSRCASSQRALDARERRVDGRVRGAARALVRAAARPGARRTCRRRTTSRYLRRLSPLESTYTKERATEVCLATLARLGFDLAATTRTSGSTSTTGRRSRRAPA